MSDRDAVRRAYDEIAEQYAAQRDSDSLAVTVLEDVFSSFSGRVHVLDAGCGQGTPVLSSVDVEDTAVGLDFSREQLTLATENAPAAYLTEGDMAALPFEDDVFDVVTAFHSLIHVPNDDHQAVIDEFARVLQPDGLLVVSEGHSEWAGSNPDWLGSGVKMQWSIAGLDATRNQLDAAGFTIIDEWNVGDSFADEEGAQKPFILAQRTE